MASFSNRFPRAYHVVPLHLWKLVAAEGALTPKGTHAFRRPTTSAVDAILGFHDVVHFYLASGGDKITKLPILRAQLQQASKPPFPHLALELATRDLADEECIVCNWNLAVSRPSVTGVCKGGNWTRGTDPQKIRAVWEALKQSRPSPSKARGYFVDGWAVPVVTGRRLKGNVELFSKAPRRMPELMLRDRVPLSSIASVVAFSEADAELARSVSGHALTVRVEKFPGYVGDLVPTAVRSRISDYFGKAGLNGVPVLDYDAIRRLRRNQAPLANKGIAPDRLSLSGPEHSACTSHSGSAS